MLRTGRTALALGLTGFLAAPAFADTVTFKNGREVHGRLVEETRDEIVMQVGSGKLRFSKKDIATFTEDSDYGQRYFTPPRRGDAADSGPSSGRRWRRPDDASQEELRDLKGVHARLEEEYAKLGPSAEARTRKLELSAAERGSLDNAIANLGRTGAGATSTQDVSAFGVRAIPALADVLQTGDTAGKTAAALALADVVTRGDADDARWLLGQSRVGVKLSTLLEASGDAAAANARNAANRALEQISGKQFSWQDSADAYPNEAQANAIKSWKLWASADQDSFDASEKKRLESVKKLDDAWKALDDPTGWRDALALAKDTYGVATADKGATPADKSNAGGGDNVNVEVAKGASPGEQSSIQAMKTRIRQCLEKTVGPSLDELKQKYALSSEDRQDVDMKIQELSRDQRRAQGQKRLNATNALEDYGLKAIEPLAGALESDDVRQRWRCASTLGKLANGADRDGALRLMLSFHVPSSIVPLLDEASDDRAADIRNDVNKALEAISGAGAGWVDGTDAAPNDAQIQATNRWRKWASSSEADAASKERLREDHRKKLNDLLKDLDRASKWREALDAASKELDKADRDLKS